MKRILLLPCVVFAFAIFINPTRAYSQDNDADGWTIAAGDCDDGNNAIHPGAEEIPGNSIDENCDGSDACTCYADLDGDNFGNPYNLFPSGDCDCDDANEASTGTDCDDGNFSIHPSASEIVGDGIDQDCNGFDAIVCYVDNDKDGYGNASMVTVISYNGTCATEDGESSSFSDCDDDNVNINPGELEIPGTGIDEDCDGYEICYYDYDSDNYGNNSIYLTAVLNCDLAGGSNNNTDCNDNNASIHPGSTEICDGFDNDCDSQIDNNPIDIQTWYKDDDMDGFGNPVIAVQSCERPGGYVSNDLDCNDDYSFIFPGAPEYCNGFDDDCDGSTDEDAYDAATWFADGDNDTFGNPNNSILSCSQPAGYVDNYGDCDDADNTVFLGATEYCDGKDNDCNGIDDDYTVDGQYWYVDYDSDTYGDPNYYVYECNPPVGYVSNDDDCDDYSPNVHPGAIEVCDHLDNNCNSEYDENAIDAITWYPDYDEDGYGCTLDSIVSCEQPWNGVYYVNNKNDCIEGDPNSHPGAPETCDGADNDCDGETDENPVWSPVWFADTDSDGYGNPEEMIHACTRPAGYTDNNEDCDDTNDEISPYEVEVCNGVDDNCDGGIDEGYESYNFDESRSICQGEIYTWHEQDYSTTGDYTYIEDFEYGCNVFRLHLTVNPTYFSSSLVEICNGAGYLWQDSIYATAGTFEHNPHTAAGCDSIFELTLTVNPGVGYAFHDTVVICSDENYLWHGNTFDETGIYENHYQTIAGCDSTYFLHLTVNPSYHFNLTTNAVIGETISWHGQTITSSGTYFDSFITASGCDSIYELTIYFREPVVSELWGSSMQGGSQNKGFVYKTDSNGDNLTEVFSFSGPNGTYPDGGLTAGPDGKLYGITLIGGDSDGGVIYSIDPVTENYQLRHSFEAYVDGFPTGTMLLASNNKLYGMALNDFENCAGTLFEFDPSTGIFVTKAQLDIQSGCKPTEVTLAEGSNHVLYGVTQGGGTNSGGVLFGYDFVSETYTVLNNFSSEGSNGNVTVASDGNLYGIRLAANNLFKYVSPEVIDVMHSFGNDSLGGFPQGRLEADSVGVLWGITREGGASNGGIIYCYDTESGHFTKLADLALVGASHPMGSLTRTSSGKLYGVTLGTTGIEGGHLFEYDPLTDSLVIKHAFGLSEEEFAFNPKLIEVCRSPQFSHNLSALDLCNPGDTMIFVNVTGNGLTFTWQADEGSGFVNLSNNAVYSGVNNDTLHIEDANSAMNGYVYRCVVSSTCPSINVNSNTSELNIRNEYHFDESATICTGSTFLWQNNLYNSAGIYDAHYNSIYGCDSTYKLTLTTTPGTGYAFYDTASICQGTIYSWRGADYSESGIYQDSYTTLAGCDSSYFLHLNINPVYEFHDVAEICMGSTYYWHNIFCDMSRTYQVNYTTVNGCDSIYYLNLIVNEEFEGYSSVENHEMCNGSSYFWMGNILSEPGVYEEHRPVEEGFNFCDSVFFLNLSVSGGPGYYHADTLEICGGDTAFWQGEAYSESGFYASNNLTTGGCDSTYYLSLTVHPSYYFAENFNAVIGDTVEWHGQLYTSSDTVVENHTTIHGCDSIYSFALHFYPRFEGPNNNELWGMTSLGGANNLGCIFKTDGNGENQTVIYSFESTGGTHPYGSLMYASNGKLYGMTREGGLNNQGTIFEYDMANDIYNDNFSFGGTTGAYPTGNLIEGENGLLYGLTSEGGSNNLGVLFSFNPETHHYQTLMQLNNYGLGNPNGSLTFSADGNLWGQTMIGGDDFGGLVPLGYGAVFEYDIVNSQMVSVKSFELYEDGIYPSGSLVESETNLMMYGVTSAGPAQYSGEYETPGLGSGTIFYTGHDESIQTIHFFEPGSNGVYPVGGLIQAQNEKLYGLTSAGGSSNAGVLYEVNPTTNLAIKKKDLTYDLTGSYPLSPMMMTCNGKLFGMTNKGGDYGHGTIFRYDVNSNTITKTHDFDVSSGATPQYSTLTEVPAVLRISSQPTDVATCRESNQSISVNAVGDNLTYQWQMSTGSGFTNITNNSVFSGTTSSSLQISNTPDSLNGVRFRCFITMPCPSKSLTSDSMTLNVNPIYQFTENHAICRGETYSWHGANYSDNGIIYAHYNTAKGCDSTYRLNLTVHELPFVYAGADMTICEGSTISLTGSGTANQYNWNNSVVNSMSFQPLANNTYIVTGINLLTGCVNYDTIDVQLQSAPDVYAGFPQSVCIGDTVTVHATGTASTYMWNNGVLDNVPFVATESAIYTVTGYDGLGCSNTDELMITTGNTPTVTLIAPDTAVCLNDPAVYLSASPASGVFSGNGVSGNMFYPSTAGLGTHQIVYFYTGPGSCSNADTIHISVHETPVVSAGPALNICEGDSATLAASGTASSYVWDNGVMDNVSFVPLNSGYYSVTGYNAYGCSDEDLTLITVYTDPVVSIILNDTVLCITDNPVYLSGMPSAGSFYGTGVNGNMFDPALAGVGDHEIIYSYTNNGGCTGSDTTTVSVIDCTGLDENNLFNVSVFPNPTAGQLNIAFQNEDEYTLLLIDALGQIIQNKSISGHKMVQIDLNSVAPGVYMLKIENAKGFVLKRVVVER